MTEDEVVKELQGKGYDVEAESGVVIVYDMDLKKLSRMVRKAGYRGSYGTRGRNPKPVTK